MSEGGKVVVDEELLQSCAGQTPHRFNRLAEVASSQLRLKAHNQFPRTLLLLLTPRLAPAPPLGESGRRRKRGQVEGQEAKLIMTSGQIFLSVSRRGYFFLSI